jgi:hypothetical protein
MIDSASDAPSSMYLDSKTAARYMGFHTVRTFRQWARRERIKAKRRSPGRVLLWRQADLDATLQDDDLTADPLSDRTVEAPEQPAVRRRRGRPTHKPRRH